MGVILTIDTTHPLNDRDRALLAALLGDQGPSAGHRPAPAMPRAGSAAAAAAAIGAAPPARAGLPASARLPVATQPGVSFTESVAESTAEGESVPG